MIVAQDVTWLEVVWTLVATVGLFVSLVNMREVIYDYRAARTLRPRNGRLLLATAGVRAEVWRVVTQAGYIAIGVCAMTLPSPEFPETARIIVGLVLILLACGSTVMAILDALLRMELNRPATAKGAVGAHTHHLNPEHARPTTSGDVE